MAKSRALKPKREVHGHPDPALSQVNLKALEGEWMASRLKGDIEFSDQLIDDEYQGATSQGCLQSKAEFLHQISQSAAPQSVAYCSENQIRVYGEMAISTGLISIDAHSFRYLRVFRYGDGHWRLIASQSTRASHSV